MAGFSSIGLKSITRAATHAGAPSLAEGTAKEVARELEAKAQSLRPDRFVGQRTEQSKLEKIDFQQQDPFAKSQVEMISLDDVRFTQAAVYHDMKDGRQISELATDLKAQGWNQECRPPDMVRSPEGFLITLDHRRLVAAKMAGLKEIPARVHPWNEPLPVEEHRRFWVGQKDGFADTERGTTYQYRQVAKNWGEAARFRSIEQRLRGISDFPLDGSFKLPELKGFQPRK